MLHRGRGRTTEPQYRRIRHPVRQKRKGLVRTHRRFRPQDRNTSRRGFSRLRALRTSRLSDSRIVPLASAAPVRYCISQPEESGRPLLIRNIRGEGPNPHRPTAACLATIPAVRWRTRNSNAAGMKAKTTDRIFLEPKITARKYCRP